MEIGFLFNHDQVGQVALRLPMALALARRAPDAKIVVATTHPQLTAEVMRLGEGLVGPRIRLVELGLTRWSSRALAAGLEAVMPATRILLYRDNLDFFRGLDLLVVADKAVLILKTHYGLKHLRIVHARRSAGDRAIGLDRASADFDLILCAGPKVRERLIAEAGVQPDRIAVVGFPTFDAEPGAGVHPLAEDGRPVVLYNPHVSPGLSSWYPIGRQVLDWFVARDDLQLIFAPHPTLFERPIVLNTEKLRLERPGPLGERHLLAPNIHIDLMGQASTTLAYARRADIYLGDASSQVYEFLARPRPCIFLNPHSLPWRRDPDFAHWRLGRVIEVVGDLRGALAEGRADHDRYYRARQASTLPERFDHTGEPHAVRAARALATFAGLAAPALARDVAPEEAWALHG